MTDFDYYSVDDIDDCDEDQVHVLIFDTASSSYGWHWIYRETLADRLCRITACRGPTVR
jgi:hypothetical protein